MKSLYVGNNTLARQSILSMKKPGVNFFIIKIKVTVFYRHSVHYGL